MRTIVRTGIAVIVIAAAGACATSRPGESRPLPAATGPAATGPAASVLARLPLSDGASVGGYRRARFGPAWADVDHNGCDTRNDVLNRDLRDLRWRPGTHGCVVLAGDLVDPYSGTRMAFAKSAADAIQIDHVVALGDAWRTGSARWSDARRVQFANDPLNLLAVSGALNNAKGDRDASGWLPPSAAFRCPYVARQIAVKAKWGLSVTPAERAAMARVLLSCPGEPVPTS